MIITNNDNCCIMTIICYSMKLLANLLHCRFLLTSVILPTTTSPTSPLYLQWKKHNSTEITKLTITIDHQLVNGMLFKNTLINALFTLFSLYICSAVPFFDLLHFSASRADSTVNWCIVCIFQGVSQHQRES